LGICSYREMLTTYFVNDIKCPEGWRLKRHAADKFYAWLATWCVFLCKPSDLNYSDEGFDLPQLNTYQHIVESGATEGALFAFEVKGLQERQAARRESMQRRIDRCVEIINSSEKPFIIWCDMNAESEGIVKAVPGAVQITGSDKPEHKEKTALDFAAGKIDVLVSKPSIIGRGLNLQACHNLAFLGLSDSFEAIFQATRRCYRHGQKHEVNRHIIISEAEGPVLQNVARKEADFMAMIGAMVEHTRKMSMENIRQLTSEKDEYEPGTCIIIPKWLKEGGY
ncbi:MAG: helicase C-terminal domain-containing protein, partial [Candidatus Methanoperedens sp.]